MATDQRNGNQFSSQPMANKMLPISITYHTNDQVGLSVGTARVAKQEGDQRDKERGKGTHTHER